MEKPFYIFIGLVFVFSILLGVLIWYQMIKFEKKALVAKKLKEEYLQKFELEQAQMQKVADIENEVSQEKEL